MSDIEQVVDNQERNPFDPAMAVYTPAETATYGKLAVETAQQLNERALGVGIAQLEDYFAPVRPGQVAGIVGQTSHAKSLLMRYIEHRAAEQVVKRGSNEVIVHISLEDSVEEQAFGEIARYSGENSGRLAYGEVRNWDDLLQATFTVAGVPIFRIGDSLARSEYIPQLYLSNVLKCLDYIRREHNVTFAMIGLDYLQALPPDPEIRRLDYESQRRLQVRMDAYRLREMASRFQCPVWVACQAKQTLGVMNENTQATRILIPGMYDINESSDVPQRFDRLLGVWLPARSYPVGTMLPIGDEQLKVTDNLFFIKVNKQRGGLPAGRTFITNINFDNNSIEPIKFKG